MTEENYKYRTSPFLLRNQFKGTGKWGIPVVPKFQAKEGDFTDLRLIGFDKTKLENDNHLDRMVYFFLYDYKFERVWKNPDTDLEKLKRYKAVLTPDFSMYIEMNPTLQLYNTFRNRWCGAYYASKGIRVIPTVSWGSENTFDFCFDGIEKGSTVAVSTYMVTEHNHHKDQKEFSLKGYNEMLKRIEPEKIICYNEPFPEMQEDIIFVDYDLSSWRYMNDDPYIPSKYAKYICGEEPLPKNSNIVIKTGYIPTRDITVKGMGSAYGGEWQPKNEDDEQLLGEPNTSNFSGYKETKIGEDGRATEQIHNTDHGTPNAHANPHSHKIGWGENGQPIFGKGMPIINGEKSFIYFKGGKDMEWTGERLYEMKTQEQLEQIRFKSIGEFKLCLSHGGEVGFKYENRYWGVVPTRDDKYAVYEYGKIETTKFYDTADDALEYMIGDVRLRDIITKVEVFDRTIN